MLLSLAHALQHAQQEPPRDYSIDSRCSTPSVHPDHCTEQFDYWKDNLETVSRLLEQLRTSAEDCRARILDAQYWQDESNHWKRLHTDRIKGGSDLPPERHLYEIDARFWACIKTANWQEIYHTLEKQSQGPRLIKQGCEIKDFRTIAIDVMYHKIAAEYWRDKCRSNPSTSSDTHRKGIRSSTYWETEFDWLSAELRRARMTPPRRRSERIEILREEMLSTSPTKRQVMRRGSKRTQVRNHGKVAKGQTSRKRRTGMTGKTIGGMRDDGGK